MLPGCVAWPEELAQRYRREGHWRGEVLGDLVRPWARFDGARTAVVTERERWSYSDLDDRADRLAAGLRRLGVRARQRVVVQLPNTPQLLSVCLALFRLGALPVFALPAHRRAELSYLCEATEAVAYVIPDTYQGFDYRVLAAELQARAPVLKHVLVDGAAGGFVSLGEVDADAELLPEPDPGEVAFFLLSGGTTGVPKLIPRTHDDYAYQLRATAEAVRFDATGVYLAVLPAAHNAALGCPGVLGTLRAGGKVALAASASPDDAFPLVEAEGVTLTTLMPALVSLWIETADLFRVDLSGVLLQVGGARLSPEVAARVRTRLGCALSHWFGMAEGLLTHTRIDDPEHVVLATQGRPLCPADELRIVDESDRELGPDQVGELLARGPYTLRGYYRAPQTNSRSFTADGFLRTGDLARITPAGNLVIEGRVKEVINRGGEKVPAEEVEDHACAHPSVSRAAAVAMPDPVLGEKTCTFVVPRGEPPTLSELRDFLQARGLADYKLPDRIELVHALPETGVGKVDRAALRARVANGART